MPLLALSLTLSGLMFWPHLARLLPDLTGRPEYRVSWSAIQVPPGGQWVPAEFLDEVRVLSDLPAELPLLDDALTARLARAFMQHPWVKDVTLVEKHPAGIRVMLTYREPVLIVQTPRGLYPVDGEGVLLPPADFTAADVDQFPRLARVKSTPQGTAGAAWGDPAVSGGARLAARLADSSDPLSPWKRYRFSSVIVVPRRGPVAEVEDTIFCLTTESGSQIIWGHAPEEDKLEPSVEQKLERLDKFLAENGGFEYQREPIRIDLTDWDVIHWDVLSRVPDSGAFR